MRIGPGMMPKMTEISGKVASATSKSNFGGPAGGSALERASPLVASKGSFFKCVWVLFCIACKFEIATFIVLLHVFVGRRHGFFSGAAVISFCEITRSRKSFSEH